MTNDRLHITFGYSAAGSLKMALTTLGLDEPVAILGDDFSMGPIDPGDVDQRSEWEREEMDTDEPIAFPGDFWERVSAWPGKVVAWMSSNAVHELCGLHVLLWRLPNVALHVVDVANFEFPADHVPPYDWRPSFAIVRDDFIVQHSLIDFARPVTDIQRATSRRIWDQLRTENAPLRILTDVGLVSKPITYYDDRIRALITDQWQKCGRVVGAMMGSVSNGKLYEFRSDEFFFVRLIRIVEGDEVEAKHDDGPDALWSFGESWVRRRPST